MGVAGARCLKKKSADAVVYDYNNGRGYVCMHEWAGLTWLCFPWRGDAAAVRVNVAAGNGRGDRTAFYFVFSLFFPNVIAVKTFYISCIWL